MRAASAVPVPAVPRVAARRNLARARQGVHALAAWLIRDESRHLPPHDVAREQEQRGREIPHLVLEAHVAPRGTAEGGPAVDVGAARASRPRGSNWR